MRKSLVKVLFSLLSTFLYFIANFSVAGACPWWNHRRTPPAELLEK
ncbi:cyclic lactone autoinducer peptide [Marinicrinis sediminis]|uniref:Cyclic lactone autoinducer peptide n=1 Tax=Marinicrinis sediminis TaxID=1652465 RepID=A0ABW5RFE3_9BACL